MKPEFLKLTRKVSILLILASTATAQNIPVGDEKFANHFLSECQNQAQNMLRDYFLRSPMLVDATWDGTLGAKAHIVARQALESKTERVNAYLESGRLNTEYLFFGLTDSWSGPKRDFRLSKCHYDSETRSLTVKHCTVDRKFCDENQSTWP